MEPIGMMLWFVTVVLAFWSGWMLCRERKGAKKPSKKKQKEQQLEEKKQQREWDNFMSYDGTPQG